MLRVCVSVVKPATLVLIPGRQDCSRNRSCLQRDIILHGAYASVVSVFCLFPVGNIWNGKCACKGNINSVKNI